MANKTFTLVPIASEMIRHNMDTAGYSIRRLGRETSYSEKSIRTYLKRGLMPEKLVHEIDDLLQPKLYPICVRFSTVVQISAEQLEKLMTQGFYYEPEGRPFIWDFTGVILNDVDAGELWGESDHRIFTQAFVDREEFEVYRAWFAQRKHLTSEQQMGGCYLYGRDRPRTGDIYTPAHWAERKDDEQ